MRFHFNIEQSACGRELGSAPQAMARCGFVAETEWNTSHSVLPEAGISLSEASADSLQQPQDFSHESLRCPTRAALGGSAGPL